MCYARTGRYRFNNVINAHTRNLELYLDNLLLEERLLQELKKEVLWNGILTNSAGNREDFQWWKSGGKAIRIHDSGDFFTYEYLLDWIDVARQNPQILFYAYTKQVFWTKKAKIEGLIPHNLVFIFSMGGKEDDLIDIEHDRHDDIFPDTETLTKSGYQNQEESDLMAALLPSNKIGIVANRIPKLIKLQGGKTFSEAQKEGLDHKQ